MFENFINIKQTIIYFNYFLFFALKNNIYKYEK